ncbi:MAG TPA: hypothetical protein VET86_13315, partial [Casimicrobiaceae bacterium]|nr:hypothetical protein [Casimicrobiaceae bacterium]
MIDVGQLPDPREFPRAESAPPAAVRLYALARDALDAPTRQAADLADHGIRAALAAMLHEEGGALAAVFAGAPAVDVARHLWRQLEAAWRARPGERALAFDLFA